MTASVLCSSKAYIIINYIFGELEEMPGPFFLKFGTIVDQLNAQKLLKDMFCKKEAFLNISN